MAGIPTAFGAFAGGLWGGATSMMSLMTSFQQYQQNELALNELREGIKQRDLAAQQAAQATTTQATAGQISREHGDQQPPADQPAQPATTQPAGPVKTTPAGTRAPTGVAPNPPQAGRSSESPVQPPPSSYQQPTTPAPQELPANRGGSPGFILNPNTGLMEPLPTTTTSPAPVVGKVPMVAPAPQAPPAEDMSNRGRSPGLVQVPHPLYPQAPASAAGVQGAPGTPSGPVQQRNVPLLPWPAPQTTPAVPQAAPAPAPTPTPTPSGTPGLSLSPQLVSQAQPQAQPQGGGGVMGALNRIIGIPSAAAQEAIPPPVVAGGPGLSTIPAAPAATSESAGQAAAKQPVTTPTAVLPAAPNYTQVSAHRPAPAPAPTAAPAVAPDQKGPTVTEQPMGKGPLVLQVDPTKWQTIQLKYPDLANAIRYAVDRYGGGQVNYEQLAYVKWRETGYETDARRIPDGDNGTSLGAMQVKADTFAGATYHQRPATGDFDPHTLQGSLNQGAAVLNYLGLKYGAGSVQMHYAYMRGEGAANYAAVYGIDAADKKYPGGKALLTRMYPADTINDGHFIGQFGNGADHREIMTRLVQGAASGPDGALRTLADYTPSGLGLDNAWRAAQSHFEMYAMIKGNFNAIPQIQNYFAGLAHQGTLSNLTNAYSALASGNTDAAAQYLAKAYAFFPDGVEGRIAVDQKGNLWAQRFDGSTQKPLGPAFQVTLDGLAAKITEAGTAPQNFLSAFMNYRKSAAEIRELNSKADYFTKMPEVRQAMAEETQRHHEEMEQAHRETQEARDAASQAKGERVQAIDTDVGKRYATENRPTGDDAPSAREWAMQGEVARQLQYPEHSGGGNLSAPMADQLAGDIRQKRATFRPFMGKDNQGRPVPSIAIFGDGNDPKKGQPDAEVSFETGRRIMGRAGYPPLVGGQGQGQGMPTTQQPRPQAAIGAGAGSPMVAMGGGFNLAGPIMNQQQQQPQPNAVG